MIHSDGIAKTHGGPNRQPDDEVMTIALERRSAEVSGDAARIATDRGVPVLDVVVPVYNEQAALADSVRRLHRHLSEQFPFTFRITIADNASSAGWILGPERVSPKDIDIRAIDAVLKCNGETVAEGRSDAVLGNPVTAVAWLARKVDGFGVRLKAGDVVLPGACMRAIDARPGDSFLAEFTGLGSVRLSFE